MSSGKEDLRVRRTRLMLKKALIDLCVEKGFSAVSVGMIAERAMVNRVTFYRHFHDKYDLASTVFGDAIEELQKEMGPPRRSLGQIAQIPAATVPLPFVRFFEHIAANRRLYAAMMRSNGDPWFSTHLREHLGAMLETRFLAQENLQLLPRQGGYGLMTRKVAVGMLSAALVGMITWWLEEGTKYKAEQMAQWVRQVMLKGLVSSSTKGPPA